MLDILYTISLKYYYIQSGNLKNKDLKLISIEI